MPSQAPAQRKNWDLDTDPLQYDEHTLPAAILSPSQWMNSLYEQRTWGTVFFMTSSTALVLGAVIKASSMRKYAISENNPISQLKSAMAMAIALWRLLSLGLKNSLVKASR